MKVISNDFPPLSEPRVVLSFPNRNPTQNPKIKQQIYGSTELSSQVTALYSGKAAEAELDVAVTWLLMGLVVSSLKGSPLIDPI